MCAECLVCARGVRGDLPGGLTGRGDSTKKPMAAHDGVPAGRRWCPVNAVDRVIRWSTALGVVGVVAVAAVVSYEHASDLVRTHGESGWTGRLIPLTVDGLIYAGSMVMLDSARRGARVPALARWLLGSGIVATLAANVAHALGHGLIGTVIDVWPAVVLVGSYEILMMIIRSEQVPAVTSNARDDGSAADPLGERAAACSWMIWHLTGCVDTRHPRRAARRPTPRSGCAGTCPP
jgi:Protein of unknown function (DUF2637)